MPDPKAPASSPRHPSQTRGRDPETVPAGANEQRIREHEAEVRELSDTHITAAERDALEVGDLRDAPQLDDLRVRRDALVDYLERREQDPEAALPEITDLTGAEHVLEVSDDGTEARWSLVPLEADSGQESAGSEPSGDTAEQPEQPEQPQAEETPDAADTEAQLEAQLAQLDKVKTTRKRK